MTSWQQRRFGRRAFVVGAGALVTGGVLQACESPDSAPSLPAPVPYAGRQQTVDLTTRWRHLERRVVGRPLAAAWQFDEGAGYAFEDVSGNGHTLYITGDNWNTTDSGLLGAIHRRGLRGGAVYLDGTRWLEAARTADLAVRGGVSVSCWVRPDVRPTGTATLVSLAGSYVLSLDSAGRVAMTVTGAGGRQHVVRTAAAIGALAWSHVTATVDPDSGGLRLYLDGEPAGHSDGAPFTMPTSAASLVVGRHLTGALDEATLGHGVLDPAAVRQLYVVGLPKVYTQTSESIDAGRQVFTRFKGSDPVPHPVVASAVLTHRFAGSARTEQGLKAAVAPPTSSFVPGVFGGAWRAMSARLSYPSPLTGDTGTFEAWYRTIADTEDPERQRRKEMFTAFGPSGALTLYTFGGRWCVDVRRAGGRSDIVTGFPQAWTPQTLEHVAVTWGQQAEGTTAVVLYVNGISAGALATADGETTYSQRVGLGGAPGAPGFCLLDDVRVCDTALPWGEVCPRGQVTTDAAGLDLRDRFDRPPGAAPLLWRPGSAGARWSHRRKTWERPVEVGDDPDSNRALFQGAPAGVHPIYHPDAFGYASSIEAGVAFPSGIDGWAGVFVQSAGPVAGPTTEPGGGFSGLTFMLNPGRSELRLALFAGGRLQSAKVLRYDFAVTSRSTYEMTLTNAGDGIIRGFVDGSNVISMRPSSASPTSGYAGILTDGARAFFSNLHFCALTPATPASRVIRTRVLRYGDGAAMADLRLVPFRWHKRRGLLPWQYTAKVPEPAGNIAGAETVLPPRPIAPAAWRSEDSANSDLITVDGRVLYFMRGNPRIDGRSASARVGVLSTGVPAFDGVHFSDPNARSGTLTAGTVLVGGAVKDSQQPGTALPLQLNEPSSAYVGDGRLLFFGRESGLAEAGQAHDRPLVFSRFDSRTDTWEHNPPRPTSWSQSGAATDSPAVPNVAALYGSPEVVSLRDPDHDAYQAVLLQSTGLPGRAVMTTALLTGVASGDPAPIPGMPLQRSLSRASGGAIYGFRVMFDNGIYYLHYNDGAQVPDWPDRFVLAATLDPYAGPWVENAATTQPDSGYFRRGSELEPDNGAIWQGTMFKHRGRYYMYYENYHSIDDVDAQYESYDNPEAGSRVGFATA